jgi:hypothetical protein
VTQLEQINKIDETNDAGLRSTLRGLQTIMAKQKRKLSPAEKCEKRRRKMEYMTIFINGKQKRVKRPPTIDGMDVDTFIRLNADPIWLHQNEMWEEMDEYGKV